MDTVLLGKDFDHDSLTAESCTSHFVSTVAHELRNPLTGISSVLQLLLMNVEESDSNHKFLSAMRSDVEKLGQIIDDMGHFCPLVARTTTPCNVVDVLKEELPGGAGEHLDAKLADLYGDKEPIRRVLRYILKFLQKTGKSLIVSSRLVSREMSGPMDQEGVVLRLAHTGSPGTQVHSKKLRRFFEDTGCHGVQLAIPVMRSIIQNAGGMLRIEKDDSEQYSFFIYVPSSIELPKETV